MQVDWECGEKDSITPITMLHGSQWLLQSSFLAVFFSMVTATSVIGQSLFRIMGSVFLTKILAIKITVKCKQ